jgi:hypothetical protein
MKEKKIRLEFKKNVQQKKPYETPRLIFVSLIADQVLAVCRYNPFPLGECEDISAHS